MINLFSSSHENTIGVDFEVKSLSVDDYKIKLQIWDISGERRFSILMSIKNDCLYNKGIS